MPVPCKRDLYCYHMKIITWNCNMAFRKKTDFILAHKPDILLVPECEHPGKNYKQIV